MINKLRDVKIAKPIIGYVAELTRSPVKLRGRYETIYKSLNNDALYELYNAFIKFESGTKGRYLEWRLANAIWWKLPKEWKEEVSDIKFDRKLLAKSGAIHEIDVVFLDLEERPYIIGEAKAIKMINKDHITKWISVVKDLAKYDEHNIKAAFFLTTGRYSDGAISMIKDEINEDGKMGVRFLKSIIAYFLEERTGGQIISVWPK